MFRLLQAPYLVYVEVLECDNVHTAPLPSKLLDTSVVQFARSEEDITRCSLPTERIVRDMDPHLCLSVEVDEPDCWSQEDDDIIKVSEIFFLLSSLVVLARLVCEHATLHVD